MCTGGFSAQNVERRTEGNDNFAAVYFSFVVSRKLKAPRWVRQQILFSTQNAETDSPFGAESLILPNRPPNRRDALASPPDFIWTTFLQNRRTIAVELKTISNEFRPSALKLVRGGGTVRNSGVRMSGSPKIFLTRAHIVIHTLFVCPQTPPYRSQHNCTRVYTRVHNTRVRTRDRGWVHSAIEAWVHSTTGGCTTGGCAQHEGAQPVKKQTLCLVFLSFDDLRKTN